MDDAVGYIERNGKLYTLPVTQDKYKEMMKEVAKEAQDFALTDEQALQSQKKAEKSEDSIALPETESCPLQMVSIQEKLLQLDDMLRGASPEQIGATYKRPSSKRLK